MKVKAEKLAVYKRLNSMDIKLTSENFMYDVVWCNVVYLDSEQYNRQEHVHSFWEIQLIIEGSSVYEYNGERYEANKDSLLIFPPFAEHRIVQISEDMLKLGVGIKIYGNAKEEEEFLKNMENATRKGCLYPCEQSVQGSLCEILENVYDMKIGYKDIININLQNIILKVFRTVAEKKNIFYNEKSYVQKKIRHEQIRNFIMDNISRKINTQTVASQFYMSAKQLDRIMMKYYGKSTSKVKRDIQIDIVKKNLKNLDMPLSEIAIISGFCDEFSMSRAFKTAVGIPPSVYRNKFLEFNFLANDK